MRPILIFGYGNPARGDDALGPELIRRLEQRQERPQKRLQERHQNWANQDKANQDRANLDPGLRTVAHGYHQAVPSVVSVTSSVTAPVTAQDVASDVASGAASDADSRAYSLADVDLLTDYQLQPEHALDFAGRARVLLVDAAVGLEEGCRLEPVSIDPAPCYSTHLMTPGNLLGVHVRIGLGEPPPCQLLRIGGYHFELGETLSEPALNNLGLAEQALLRWLDSL